MARLVKILALLLVILSVFTCGVIALFLQTVFALTREIPVAQVVMSSIQSDTQGEYIMVEYIPYDRPSALIAVINRGQQNAPDEESAMSSPCAGHSSNCIPSGKF
jgi:hypothetical protein